MATITGKLIKRDGVLFLNEEPLMSQIQDEYINEDIIFTIEFVNPPLKFRPMNKKKDFGDLIPLEEFIECVEAGCFMDDDGVGDYCTENTISNKGVDFYIINHNKNILEELKSKGITHVMWYNK